jgi:sarcosine oxidase
MRVAVVGAGIVGSNTARYLAQRGHSVTLFEQFPIGHRMGSSHGRSRIVRKAYPDAFYTERMLQAYPLWHALQDEVPGEQILHECGLLYFGPEGSPGIESLLAALHLHRVEHEVLGPRDVRRVHPTLRLHGGEVGVFSRDGGWVHADRAVGASARLAVGYGARLVQARIEDPRSLEAEFDRVVLCAGAWSAHSLALPVTVSLQTVVYIGADQSGPVWIEDGPDGIYGFPSEPEAGIKIGVHAPGRTIHPDDPDRTPDPGRIERMREFASRRFGIPNPQVTEALGCLYTNAPNEDFLLGRIGDRGFFASACSGHGFKFGPWIGLLLADCVEGVQTPEQHPRFQAAL